MAFGMAPYLAKRRRRGIFIFGKTSNFGYVSNRTLALVRNLEWQKDSHTLEHQHASYVLFAAREGNGHEMQ